MTNKSPREFSITEYGITAIIDNAKLQLLDEIEKEIKNMINYDLRIPMADQVTGLYHTTQIFKQKRSEIMQEEKKEEGFNPQTHIYKVPKAGMLEITLNVTFNENERAVQEEEKERTCYACGKKIDKGAPVQNYCGECISQITL